MMKKILLAALIVSVLLTLVSCGGESAVEKSADIGRADVVGVAYDTLVPETKAPEDDGKIEIVMVGDILLHETVSESGLQEDGSYNYDHLFANVKDKVEGADLALVNQEVILGGRDLGLSGYPNFNGAYEVGDALVNAGFDVVLHATNHALDKGKTGIVNCLDFWKAHPEITVVGINESEQAQNTPAVVEVEGVKIAILNYTYGTNGMPIPSDMPYAVNLLDKASVENDVAKAKEMSDFVIVCPHWGTEYIHTVSKEQEYWTTVFANCGVDLVIGTHPHVIEPFEEISRPDGGTMYVYYSLGNFINATAGSGSGTADRMVGAMADVILTHDENGVGVESCDAIGLVTQMKQGRGEITTYFMTDYTEELAQQNEIVSRDSAFSVSFCNELFASVFNNV